MTKSQYITSTSVQLLEFPPLQYISDTIRLSMKDKEIWFRSSSHRRQSEIRWRVYKYKVKYADVGLLQRLAFPEHL